MDMSCGWGAVQRFRVMGLRAIMDGRGVAACLLTSGPSISFYGRGQGALVVTAADCIEVPCGQGRTQPFWTDVAAAMGTAPAIGYEGDDLDPRQVVQLSHALRRRPLIDLAADIRHHRLQSSPGT